MKLLHGDCLEVLRTLPDGSIHSCVTSPPYWGLRDYGVDGQLGIEKTPEEYVAKMVEVFREVRRVLRDDGTLWLNLGDTQRDGFRTRVPWRTCEALLADGWFGLVSEIIWHKTAVMPMGLKRRPLPDHEFIFCLSKGENYYWDQEAVKVPSKPESRERQKRDMADVRSGFTKHLRVSGEITPRQGPRRKIVFAEKRIIRTVWSVRPAQFKGAHFATFPEKLVEPCVLAGVPFGGTVLDPFAGAGTTGVVALKHGREFIGIELNPEYIAIAAKRLAHAQP